jgi:hypothetical protein
LVELPPGERSQEGRLQGGLLKTGKWGWKLSGLSDAFPRIRACSLTGLNEKAPEQENAQDYDNSDDDDLDQAHSEILNVRAKSGTKALKRANSTSLDKQLSTNLPTHFAEFWPRCGYEKAYEGGTGVVLHILGPGRTKRHDPCASSGNTLPALGTKALSCD